MKILCLTDGFSLGGAERQLIGLAYFLKCKGYDVDLCSYLQENFYSQLMESYGLNHISLSVNGGKLKKFLAVKKQIKRGRYDWIISYKYGATFIPCMLKAAGANFKLIVSDRNTNISKDWHDDLKFFLFSFADFIVPNAYAQQRFILENYSKLRNKVITITNYTDTNYFVPLRKEVDSKSKTEIMVAARIASQKNIIAFLIVIYNLKKQGHSFHVTWFGNVSHEEEKYEAKCYEKLSELALEDVFEFKPATRDILNEYQKCDVFCLPSLYEGYPNAVCEAMSCGKPILCSRVCDNPSIVEEGVNGMMFDPNKIEEMVDVIGNYLEEDIERKQEMGIKSRMRAESLFSEEAFVEKYIKLINSI